MDKTQKRAYDQAQDKLLASCLRHNGNLAIDQQSFTSGNMWFGIVQAASDRWEVATLVSESDSNIKLLNEDGGINRDFQVIQRTLAAVLKFGGYDAVRHSVLCHNNNILKLNGCPVPNAAFVKEVNFV